MHPTAFNSTISQCIYNISPVSFTSTKPQYVVVLLLSNYDNITELLGEKALRDTGLTKISRSFVVNYSFKSLQIYPTNMRLSSQIIFAKKKKERLSSLPHSLITFCTLPCYLHTLESPYATFMGLNVQEHIFTYNACNVFDPAKALLLQTCALKELMAKTLIYYTHVSLGQA